MSDYRKLIVWVRAKDLAVAVHRMVRRPNMTREHVLCEAEEYARGKPQDRADFLNMARGSCAELESRLLISHEVALPASKEAADLRLMAEAISRMLYALRARIRDE